MDPASENLILNGLRSGGLSRHLFEKDLYKAFFYLIREAAKKYGIETEEAASIYSDTIIAIIKNIISGKFEGRSSLKTYTYQIFSNKCVDLLRKKTTNKGKLENTMPYDSLVYELPDETRSVIQALIAKDERQQVMDRLQEIGDKCKELLLLFEEGYNDKEIAGHMKYQSANVVKTTRLRCLEKLKLKLVRILHQNE
ncbi:RNA polymerase sigma factor [Mucilaginibacter aquaedulcis]|jgi:RNA polymerase sigma factor (sigma-70 family)|uniref:RNA polymerase sigma factor n=1 Tax=Mucilaginibacter aquaedulcis TaxID=1187081 RepID=UPI0025B355CB|nr:sigma-70 family RNA polymerase sigma factor [Mucilaginibacter aquaedulcis]MDN3549543.1 sigma-70 family RNA polymerase sigma factor [Mucilaginibacter aquaedulcis]